MTTKVLILSLRWDMLVKRFKLLCPTPILNKGNRSMEEFLAWQKAIRQWVIDLDRLELDMKKEMGS